MGREKFALPAKMQAVGPTSARNGPPLGRCGASPPVSIPSIGVIAIPPSMSQKAGTSATDPFNVWTRSASSERSLVDRLDVSSTNSSSSKFRSFFQNDRRH
jgi:hypothetical protein